MDFTLANQTAPASSKANTTSGDTDDYRLIKVIGKGTYSTVYLCEHTASLNQ